MSEQLEVFLSRDEIARKVKEMGAQITRDFQGRDLALIGLLRGCFIFMADLVRCIDLPLTVDFMEVSSYDDNLTSSGNVKILKDIKNSIEGKHVMLIEDVIDTGHTLNFVFEHLTLKRPSWLGIAGLLVKAQKHKFKAPINYHGFEIPDHFVVGYGMDVAGKLRNLDHVAIYKNASEM
ncbi:MAG: hypoxanthine phosphoribosyltransferase [Leptospirales bacterium]|nr:hypoxanthine phosphoribosyltransferase [Leptospirales bacterium]